MKKFTVEVTLTQTVTIEIDETKFNEEEQEDFRRHFYSFHTWEEHASHIAQMVVRDVVGGGNFIEGYGGATINGVEPRTENLFGIKVTSGPEDVETDVTEVLS